MKTKNNVQKKTTKLVTLGLILVAISIGVNAQNSGNQLAEILAMVYNTAESYTSSNKTDVFASFLVEEKEEKLELEDWMTDENSFDAYSMNVQPALEETLELEAWMMDESTFNHLSFQVIKETETELKLESWMTSDKIWNR